MHYVRLALGKQREVVSIQEVGYVAEANQRPSTWTACLQQGGNDLNEQAKQLRAYDTALLCATRGWEHWAHFSIDLHPHANVPAQPRESIEKHPGHAHTAPLLEQKIPIHRKGHAEVKSTT